MNQTLILSFSGFLLLDRLFANLVELQQTYWASYSTLSTTNVDVPGAQRCVTLAGDMLGENENSILKKKMNGLTFSAWI